MVLPLVVYMAGLGFCLLSSEPILELKQEDGFIHEINNFCSSFLFFYLTKHQSARWKVIIQPPPNSEHGALNNCFSSLSSNKSDLNFSSGL